MDVAPIESATNPEESKRILYVITKATWGGSQRYVYDLIVEAKRRGYEPQLAYGTPGRLKDKCDALQVTSREIPGLAREVSLANDWRAFKTLIALFRELAPDTIHLNSSKAAFLGSVAARVASAKRVVFTAHGWAFTEPRSSLSKLAFGIAHYTTALLSNAVIANSSATYRHARDWWFIRGKLVEIPIGMDGFKALNRADAREALIKKDPSLAAARDAYWVGTIAELHKNKGLDVGIEAWHKAKLPAHWVVIGDGEEDRALRNRSRSHADIHWLGFIEDADAYLKAFDAFMLPSRNESAGYVLLEAGLMGIPVIATDAGGIPGILAGAGALAERENPLQLADRLMETYYSAKERERLAKRFHERVLAEFGLAPMLERTFAAYSA